MKHSREFMIQGIMMGAFTVLMRAIGVSFGVYVVSVVGAATAGLSALISGVFGFAVTLALSGIGLGCTRLVAEGLGTGDGARIRRTLICAITYALFFGTLSGGLLFFCSEPIAALGLRHAEVAIPLRIMACSLPAMALSSCLTGYFVAIRRVYKSTLIQAGEQLLRILLTLVQFRSVHAPTPSHALLLLARADTLACVSAALCMLALFLLDRRRHGGGLASPPKTSPSLRQVARHLLAVTLPVAVSAYARSGLISLEHLLIPIGLAAFGQQEQDALATLGALQSMALPVLLFPGAIPAAFSSLLVPEVTESHVRKERSRIRGITQRVLSLSLLFAVCTAGVMFTFADELGTLLYDDLRAAHFIRLLAPLIPVMYLDSAVDALLKGMGQQVYSMGINIIDASLSVVLVFLLTPRMGIYGYAVTIVITELVNAALSIARLLHITRVRVYPVRWALLPVLSALGAFCMVSLLSYIPCLVHLAQASKIAFLALFILVSVLLYTALAISLGALRLRELRWLLGLFRREDRQTTKKTAAPVDGGAKMMYNKGNRTRQDDSDDNKQMVKNTHPLPLG